MSIGWLVGRFVKHSLDDPHGKRNGLLGQRTSKRGCVRRLVGRWVWHLLEGVSLGLSVCPERVNLDDAKSAGIAISEHFSPCPAKLQPPPTLKLPLPTCTTAPAQPQATAYWLCIRPCFLQDMPWFSCNANESFTIIFTLLIIVSKGQPWLLMLQCKKKKVTRSLLSSLSTLYPASFPKPDLIHFSSWLNIWIGICAGSRNKRISKVTQRERERDVQTQA